MVARLNGIFDEKAAMLASLGQPHEAGPANLVRARRTSPGRCPACMAARSPRHSLPYLTFPVADRETRPSAFSILAACACNSCLVSGQGLQQHIRRAKLARRERMCITASDLKPFEVQQHCTGVGHSQTALRGY